MGPWRIHDRYEVCDKVCVGVVFTSSLFCGRSPFSLVDKIPGKEFYNNWVPFEESIYRQIGEIRASLSLHLLFFTCLQLKIMSTSQWHIWGGIFRCPPPLRADFPARHCQSTEFQSVDSNTVCTIQKAHTPFFRVYIIFGFQKNEEQSNSELPKIQVCDSAQSHFHWSCVLISFTFFKYICLPHLMEISWELKFSYVLCFSFMPTGIRTRVIKLSWNMIEEIARK